MKDDASNTDGREESADCRPTVTVPKYKRGDEVVEWMEVDEEWWEHTQKARNVHEQVVETYRDDPGVEYIEISRGEETIAGRSTSRITITVADGEAADALSVPDDVDGIPLTVQIDRITDTK